MIDNEFKFARYFGHECIESIFIIHIMSKSILSGYTSVDLHPVAAVSVQLFSGDTELHVCGPVQISLSIPDSPGLQPSSVIPAWFFNQTTGECMICGIKTKKYILLF